MNLHMTPELLEGAYEYLRVSPPFNKWSLPHPDDIIFRVNNSKEVWGAFNAWTDGTREIVISAFYIKSLDELTRTMAHEMVHLRQELTKHNDFHGPWFQKWARQVCHRHGWNLATF